MELKALRSFVAIVEAGSISAAARQLHLSQPPLSARLQALEEELGVPLIERGARHTTPTQAGRALYQRAKKLLLLADAAAEEVARLAGEVQGVLRLGLISSCGPTLLTSAFAAFCRRHPRLRFELQEGNTYELLELLRAGAIEVAVLRTPFQQQGLRCRPLPPEPLAAAGPPALLDPLGPGPLALPRLAELPLCYYRRFLPLLEEAFHRHGLAFTGLCAADDARTALSWAEAGLGVALAPLSAAQAFARASGGALALRRVAEPGLTTAVTVAVRATAPLSPAAEGFFDLFGPGKG